MGDKIQTLIAMISYMTIVVVIGIILPKKQMPARKTTSSAVVH